MSGKLINSITLTPQISSTFHKINHKLRFFIKVPLRFLNLPHFLTLNLIKANIQVTLNQLLPKMKPHFSSFHPFTHQFQNCLHIPIGFQGKFMHKAQNIHHRKHKQIKIIVRHINFFDRGELLIPFPKNSPFKVFRKLFHQVCNSGDKQVLEQLDPKLGKRLRRFLFYKKRNLVGCDIKGLVQHRVHRVLKQMLKYVFYIINIMFRKKREIFFIIDERVAAKRSG